MKKLFAIFAILFAICFTTFAEEKTFLNAGTFAENAVDGYSYDNWEVRPMSSLKGVPYQIKIVDGKLAICVQEIPENRYVYYDIVPPYNPIITEADKEFGYLTNVGELKKLGITVNGINRNDEVSIFLATDPKDPIGKEYKFKGNLQTIGEVVLEWENKEYIDDPNKRDVLNYPAYGGKNSNELYIRAIRIRTIPITGYDVSVVYISDVKVIYDLAYTEKELEIIKSTDETFNLKSGDKTKIEEKEKEAIKLKAALIEREKEKMDSSGDAK